MKTQGRVRRFGLSCFSLLPSRPEGFTEKLPHNNENTGQEDAETKHEEEEGCSSEEDDSDLFVNTNRCNYQYSESEEDDTDEEDKPVTENGS